MDDEPVSQREYRERVLELAKYLIDLASPHDRERTLRMLKVADLKLYKQVTAEILRLSES